MTGTNQAINEKEICNECGRSVAFGSGWFVNRVPDLDTIEERREAGKPFPEGGWLCAECEARIFNGCPIVRRGVMDCPNDKETYWDELELERRLGK